MKTLHILKMGSTFDFLFPRLGDFDDWVMAQIPSNRHEHLQIVHPQRDFPDPRRVSAVIITGSHTMLTGAPPWDQRAMRWLEDVIHSGASAFGICYGHQMLARIFGGLVGNLPDGPEIGYEWIDWSGHTADPLFSVLSGRTEAFAFHYQTALVLPVSATVFGRSSREPHHGVRFADRVWGVQFHPEFTMQIATAYLVHEAREIWQIGRNPLALIQTAGRERAQDGLIRGFSEKFA